MICARITINIGISNERDFDIFMNRLHENCINFVETKDDEDGYEVEVEITSENK